VKIEVLEIVSHDLLIQAAKEYNGPLDIPPAFLSKYGLAPKGGVAGAFLLRCGEPGHIVSGSLILGHRSHLFPEVQVAVYVNE
jgi:hypothetical protein